MYEAHFGFSEKPFNLTPDPKYLYLSPRHDEAFAHLEFGRRERGGFILITGEVGTGKTTLARWFLSRLDAGTATAFVLYPAVTAVELFRTILEDLHVPVTGESLKDHVDALHRFLLDAHRQGRDVVLVIDEAQDLSPEVLEQVRLISNLETDTEKLIQIVLMGQSELKDMLARHELRQLAQRITARYHLTPLADDETAGYVLHRLKVAGGEGKVHVTADAVRVLHARTGGVPRLINLVCDRALLAAYVEGSRVVTREMVARAYQEVRGADSKRGLRRTVWAGLAAGLAVVAALGLLAAWRWAGAAPGPAPLADAPAANVPAAPPPTLPAPPTPAPDPLASRLLSLERGASFEDAVGRIQALWGPGALERTTLRTHLDQVRRLDLPVVLEMFHPSRADTCFLALVRIRGDRADVSAGGAMLDVALDELDRLWTRQALYLWRDFDDAGHDPARGAVWVRRSLARLGYAGDDPDLARVVARFQRGAELAPDGIVGSRTLMTLYALADYPRPRLDGGPS